MSLRRIASHRLLLPNREWLCNPLLTLDDKGRILSIESVERIDSVAGVEFYAGVVVPAFVNAHCHLELSHMRGVIPRRCGFAGFARAMGSSRGRFSDEERRDAMEAAAAKMWADGIAAVGDISNGEKSFEVKSRSKILFRNWIEFFGLNSLSDEPLRPLLRHENTLLTPHSIYSVQEAPFRKICSEGEQTLSIHFMESAGESDLFSGSGELAEWYAERGFTCDFLHYGSPARRIVGSVPAERSVMLVHNCCLTEEDIDLIMSHFTAPVWWCLSPRSNDYISGLKPPIDLMRRKGLNICVGTDSLASNESLSIIEELKLLQRQMPLDEALHSATAVGADALGFGDKLGRLEVGLTPGVVLIEGVDFDTMTLRADARSRRLV